MNERTQRIIGSGVVIVLVVVVCFLVAYAVTLSQVEFTEARIKEVSVAQNGLLIAAEYGVRNDGLFTVELEGISYSLTLNETNEALGEGILSGEVLPPDVTTRLDATIPVVWTPTAQSLATLYTKGSATIILSGTAHVSAGPFTIDSPFTTTINVTQYAQAYAQQEQENFLKQLGLTR
jgi:LEA14-like dessication related protein